MAAMGSSPKTLRWWPLPCEGNAGTTRTLSRRCVAPQRRSSTAAATQGQVVLHPVSRGVVSGKSLATPHRPPGPGRRLSDRQVVLREGRHVGWWVEGRAAGGRLFMKTWWPTQSP
jgi:hypothetical protein